MAFEIQIDSRTADGFTISLPDNPAFDSYRLWATNRSQPAARAVGTMSAVDTFPRLPLSGGRTVFSATDRKYGLEGREVFYLRVTGITPTGYETNLLNSDPKEVRPATDAEQGVGITNPIQTMMMGLDRERRTMVPVSISRDENGETRFFSDIAPNVRSTRFYQRVTSFTVAPGWSAFIDFGFIARGFSLKASSLLGTQEIGFSFDGAGPAGILTPDFPGAVFDMRTESGLYVNISAAGGAPKLDIEAW